MPEVSADFDLDVDGRRALRVIEQEIEATRQAINECEKQIFAYQDKIAVGQQELSTLLNLREKCSSIATRDRRLDALVAKMKVTRNVTAANAPTPQSAFAACLVPAAANPLPASGRSAPTTTSGGQSAPAVTCC